MLAMGVIDSPWAVLAIPGAVLVSAAFAAPAVFGTTLMRSWADFAFVELFTLPMFLFSATFVPADTYPDAVRWILPLTPLYHGVEIVRPLLLGSFPSNLLLHVGVLVAYSAAGFYVATVLTRKRLLN